MSNVLCFTSMYKLFIVYHTCVISWPSRYLRQPRGCPLLYFGPSAWLLMWGYVSTLLDRFPCTLPYHSTGMGCHTLCFRSVIRAPKEISCPPGFSHNLLTVCLCPSPTYLPLFHQCFPTFTVCFSIQRHCWWFTRHCRSVPGFPLGRCSITFVDQWRCSSSPSSMQCLMVVVV